MVFASKNLHYKILIILQYKFNNQIVLKSSERFLKNCKFFKTSYKYPSVKINRLETKLIISSLIIDHLTKRKNCE